MFTYVVYYTYGRGYLYTKVSNFFIIQNTAKGRPKSSTNMLYTSNPTIDRLRK
jgi:hypothetical protein